MINKIVSAAFDVKGNENYIVENRNTFPKMTKLSIDSFRKNVKGVDLLETFKGILNNYQEVFMKTFDMLDEEYHKEDCNILWVDSDMICIKPFKVFDVYDKFTCFIELKNGWCKMPEDPDIGPEVLACVPWFNTALKYFPANMNEDIWDLGREHRSRWKNIWPYDNFIYNAMFHSQFDGVAVDEIRNEYVKDGLCYDWLGGEFAEDNHATIVHMHATKSSSHALYRMDQLYKRYIE